MSQINISFSQFKNKNVLVAGGSGFIGTNLTKMLADIGANVLSTYFTKEPKIIADNIEYLRCNFLLSEDCNNAVKDQEYVFMCAANTSGAAVIASTPLVHVTPNIIMNSQMLEASYLAGVKKFIFISSNAAYPPSGNRPVKESEMFDRDPYDTYFGVGWMKRYTEILCKLYSEKLKNPMKTVIVRPSNIYGPYDDFDFATSHVMAATIRKVIERHNPIEVWGNGNDIRDLIYIDDFIDGLLLATEKMDDYKYDPINIAYGKGYSIKEILQMILEIDRYNDAKIIYDSSKPSMIPIRIIDIEKAEELLGFRPKIDIKEGIKRTVDWYRKNTL